MSKLLPVFIFSLIMAYISDKRAHIDFNKFGDKIYRHKEKIFFFLMAVVAIVFVGLRTSYNDTLTYINMYESLEAGISNIASLDFSLGENPGFWIVNIILKTLGFSTQSYIMFYAVITLLIYFWFVRKYSDNIWLSVFLFFTMGCYTFAMAAIKQCVAVAFCLVGIDRLLREKKISFVFWILLASTFHPYSLMYLIAPFLMFKSWTNKTYILLVVFGLIGLGIQPLLGTVVDITTMLGEEYDASTFTGEGINIFRLAVVWVPVIVSFFVRKYLREVNTKKDNLILNLTILNAEIMFIGLFGTANYFGRLANYFLIFQTLCLPHLFNGFTTRSKKIITIICVICFLLYFYYANVINQYFDNGFNSISFLLYIREVISG